MAKRKKNAKKAIPGGNVPERSKSISISVRAESPQALTWRISDIDREGPWGVDSSHLPDANGVYSAMRAFERQTWNELQSGGRPRALAPPAE